MRLPRKLGRKVVITLASLATTGCGYFFVPSINDTTLLIPDDEDADGVVWHEDNCPKTFNPDQADENNNGRGDACDNTPNGDEEPIAEKFSNLPDGVWTSNNFDYSLSVIHRGATLYSQEDDNSEFRQKIVDGHPYVMNPQSGHEIPIEEGLEFRLPTNFYDVNGTPQRTTLDVMVDSISVGGGIRSQLNMV